jgi:hypothetical protein
MNPMVAECIWLLVLLDSAPTLPWLGSSVPKLPCTKPAPKFGYMSECMKERLGTVCRSRDAKRLRGAKVVTSIADLKEVGFYIFMSEGLVCALLDVSTHTYQSASASSSSRSSSSSAHCVV